VTFSSPDQVTLQALAPEARPAMVQARLELLDVIALFNRSGGHPVRDVIAAGPQPFTWYQHYPPGDIDDVPAGYAWYYHAHEPSEQRPWSEHGHFHCYAYPALLAGATPLVLPPHGDADTEAGLVHLLGLSCSDRGVPNRLFTINRWASNEPLYAATDLLPLISRFTIAPDLPFPLVGRWLSAMLRVLTPHVTWLMQERDRVFAEARTRDPLGYSEDRSLDVVSTITFDLDAHLKTLAD
jgi:hypothetical protein